MKIPQKMTKTGAGVKDIDSDARTRQEFIYIFTL